MKKIRYLLCVIGIILVIILLFGHSVYTNMEFKNSLHRTTFNGDPAWGKINNDGTYSFYRSKSMMSLICTFPQGEATHLH